MAGLESWKQRLAVEENGKCGKFFPFLFITERFRPSYIAHLKVRDTRVLYFQHCKKIPSIFSLGAWGKGMWNVALLQHTGRGMLCVPTSRGGLFFGGEKHVCLHISHLANISFFLLFLHMWRVTPEFVFWHVGWYVCTRAYLPNVMLHLRPCCWKWDMFGKKRDVLLESGRKRREREASSSTPFQSVRMGDAIIQWGPIRMSQTRPKTIFRKLKVLINFL